MGALNCIKMMFTACALQAAGIDPWASLGIQIGKSLYQPTGSYITEVGNTTQGTCGFVTLYDQEGPFSEDVLAV